jgi:hypothetical protein
MIQTDTARLERLILLLIGAALGALAALVTAPKARH